MGYEIVRPFDRHGNETATVRKYNKYNQIQHVQKLMLVFLGQFENRGIKITRVNSIRITKFNNLL